MPCAKDLRSSAHHRTTRGGPSHTVEPGPEYWLIDDIIDERKTDEGIEYRVRWEGRDPQTLRAWRPSWIPKGWANDIAEIAWQKRKLKQNPANLPAAAVPDPSNISEAGQTDADAEISFDKEIRNCAYVQVPSVSILKDRYPLNDRPSQSSHTSSEASRDTQSWREDLSQRSILLETQSASSSQPFEGTVGSSQAESSVTVLPSQEQWSQRAATIPSSSYVASEIESCSIRRISLSNSNSLTERSSYVELSSIASIPSAQVVTPIIASTIPYLHTQSFSSPVRRAQATTVRDSESFKSVSCTPPSTKRSYFTPQQSVTIVHESPSAAGASVNPKRSPTIANCSPIVISTASQSSSKSTLNSESPALHLEYTQTVQSLDQTTPDNNNTTQLSGSSLHTKTNDNMSSSINGSRQQSYPSPPMQDRVRSIRNSAISNQNRRGTSDDSSPASSRANSLAPDMGRTKASNGSRAGSRPPEAMPISQFLEHFPQDSDSSESSASAKYELNLPPNGENMEYFLTMPLPGRVKNQYDTTIKLYGPQLSSFLDGVLDAETVESMERLIERLNNVSTHIDLENEEWSKTQNELPEDQTKWALSSGSKFVFLKSLCDTLRDDNMHVVVVAKEQRLLFILEKFMQGIRIDYVRPDSGKRTIASSQSRLKVSLIQSGAAAQKGPWSTANVVVAFDSSFDASAKNIQTLRQNSACFGGMAPVVHPMVYCSAEHLSKCVDRLEELRTDQEKLRALILAIAERQAEVGEMKDEDFRADAAGEEVGQFVQGGGSRSLWTLIPVRAVKVPSLETILPEDASPDPEAATNLQDALGSPSRKRQSEDDHDEDGQKRQRMSPMDTTHISESTMAASSAQVTELRQALDAAETAARKAEQRLATMQNTLSEKEQEVNEKGRVIDGLQNRYEKSKRSITKQIEEKKALEQQLAEARGRYEKFEATKGQLKEESRHLATQLEQARGELAQSQIPEVAQLEQIRGENRTLQSDKEKLERKAQGISQDFEFTRQQYQQASNAAAEHAQRIQALEEENEVLRRKASGAAAQAREMTNRQEVEQHLSENARLLAEVEELKEQLKRKERGRGMTTRTGSAAPRSPRLGTSPGRSRAGSRAPGSRPGSPVRNIHGARRRGAPLESL